MNGRFKSAIEGVVELLLGWDRLVTTGFVLGYPCVAWGLFAVAFVVFFGQWIDELQFPRL